MKLQYLCYCIWTCKMHTNPPKCKNGRLLLDMIWRRLCILFSTTRREDDAIQKQSGMVRLLDFAMCTSTVVWPLFFDKWNPFLFKSLLHPWTPSNGANVNNGHLDTHPNYCKHCEAPIVNIGQSSQNHVVVHEVVPPMWVEPHPQPCCLLEQ